MTMNCRSVAICIILSLSVDLLYTLKGSRRNRLLPERMKKAQIQTEYSSEFPEQWHKQRLDHFNASSTEYGKQNAVFIGSIVLTLIFLML